MQGAVSEDAPQYLTASQAHLFALFLIFWVVCLNAGDCWGTEATHEWLNTVDSSGVL